MRRSASARRRARARGFTLVELVTYLALVTAALTTMGGIELAASRAAFLERALLAINQEQDAALSAFAEDVARASSVAVEDKGAVLVVRSIEGTVRWAAGKDERGHPALVRSVARTDGKNPPDRAFTHAESWRASATVPAGGGAPLVKLELSIAIPQDQLHVVRKSFERTARSLGWEAP
jgi:hypothetical protein